MRDLVVEVVPVNSLVPSARNPRKNDAAAKRLAETIRVHGWTNPVLAQAGTRRVLAGHTRLKAAAILKMTDVPTIFLDVDDRQADAIMVADNRLGELAEWDDAMLADILAGLADAGEDIAAIGWEASEVAALTAGMDIDGIDEGEAFGTLPTDTPTMTQMTFTLSHEQAQDVRSALDAAKRMGPFVDTGNENSNGNALARVAEAFRG